MSNGVEKFEVAIIGGGPAGLMAAKTLAEAGKKVIVLEKNQIIGRKVCAGGVFPAVFKLGIPQNLIERKFYSIRFHLPWHKMEIRSKNFLLATINRENLGQWVAREAEKVGAEILTNSEVKIIGKDYIILKDRRSIYFDYLIGADGGSSLVRSYLNLPLKLAIAFQYTLPKSFESLEIFYDPKLFGSGYAWIFPHKNWVKIGCGSDLKFQNGNKLRENFHHWLRKMKINIEGQKLEGAIINYDYRGYQFGNMFLIGEAAGFVSGLSGAGIYPALISGQEIAKKILNPNYKPKINSILLSHKIQEGILRIMEFNQKLTLFFQEILILGFFFKVKFSSLLNKLTK
jgi:geranylgeranyl reductase